MKHLFAIIAVVCMAAPAFAQRTITKGATDETVELLIIDSTDGTPETGVVYNTSGIDLWYQRPGAAKTSITEATLSALTDAHSDGGFLAISNGVYRLDLPDAAFATGVSHVTIGGTVTGMIVKSVTVQLVDAQPVKITPFYGGDLQEDSGVYYFEFTATVNGTPATLTSGAVQGSLDSAADSATGLTLSTIATGRYEVAIDTDNAVFNGGGNLNLTLSAGTVNGISVTNAKVGEVSVGRYASAPSNFESLSVDGSGRVDVAKISGTTQTARDIGASVLLSPGTGTGQISFSSGLLAWNPAWDAEAQSEATDALNAYDPPTNAEMDARTLPTASYATASALATVAGYIDTEIGSIIASLTTIDDYIDTEVAAIKTVTDQLIAAQSEPTGVPAANETPLQKIARLYMVMRNGIEITANSKSIKDDAGNVEWVKPLADDETTFTEGEAEAP